MFLFLFLVPIKNSFGQENLFSLLPIEDNDLTETQLLNKQKVENNSTTQSIQFIKIEQIPAIQQNGIVQFELPNSTIPYLFKAKHVAAPPGTTNYKWSGELISCEGDTSVAEEYLPYGSLTVIHKNGRTFGELVIDTSTYHIKYLGEDLTALVEQKQLDDSPECPMTSNYSSDIIVSDNKNKTEYPTCPVRLLVLYTQAALDNNSDIMDIIDLSIEETKQTLSNSKIYDNNLDIQLVGTALLDSTQWGETGFVLTDRASIATNTDILALRAVYHADIVMILTDEVYAEAKGFVTAIGETTTAVDSAFAVVEAVHATSPSYTFPHEFGHLFGAHHEGTDICFNNGDDTGLAYAHGYIIEKGRNCLFTSKKHYRTTMAVCVNSIYPRIPYFSTPRAKYKEKRLGLVDSNNNARRIRGSACRVAGYIDSEVPILIINGEREACPGESIVLQAEVHYLASPLEYEWSTSSDGFNWTIVSTDNDYFVPMPTNNGDIVYVYVKVTSTIDGEVVEKLIQLEVVINDCPIELKGTFDSNVVKIHTSKTKKGLERNVEKLSFDVYPNPANNYIYIDIKSKSTHNIKIQLNDLLGQTIQPLVKYPSQESDKMVIAINTANLPSGIYWLTVGNKDYKQTLLLSILH